MSKAVVSTAVRLRECPLTERPLYFIFESEMQDFKSSQRSKQARSERNLPGIRNISLAPFRFFSALLERKNDRNGRHEYHNITYREAKANTGKKTPRQCLKLTSSSVVGLYHNKRSLKNSLALRTRPDNNNLASPSAATLRKSLLCKEEKVKYSGLLK